MNNPTPLIVLPNGIPNSALPAWDQFSQEHQQELIQVLANLLLHLPQLQALETQMTAAEAAARGAGHEHPR
jgi:hypothetical protein